MSAATNPIAAGLTPPVETNPATSAPKETWGKMFNRYVTNLSNKTFDKVKNFSINEDNGFIKTTLKVVSFAAFALPLLAIAGLNTAWAWVKGLVCCSKSTAAPAAVPPVDGEAAPEFSVPAKIHPVMQGVEKDSQES